VVVVSFTEVGLVVLRTHRKRTQARGKRDLAGRAMRAARKVFGELSRGH